jgi:hypothetical protein
MMAVAVEEEEAFAVVVEEVVDHNRNLVAVDNIVVEEDQKHLMDHMVDFVDNHIVEMDVEVVVHHHSN